MSTRNKICPLCNENLKLSNIYTLKIIKCSNCNAQLQTNVVMRLTIIGSLIGVILFAIYTYQMKEAANAIIIWSSYILIAVPIIIVNRLSVFIQGYQRSWQSIVINFMFIVTIFVLLFGMVWLRKG